VKGSTLLRQNIRKVTELLYSKFKKLILMTYIGEPISELESANPKLSSRITGQNRTGSRTLSVGVYKLRASGFRGCYILYF